MWGDIRVDTDIGRSTRARERRCRDILCNRRGTVVLTLMLTWGWVSPQGGHFAGAPPWGMCRGSGTTSPPDSPARREGEEGSRVGSRWGG